MTWQVQVFNQLGSVSIDSSQAHSGTQSVSTWWARDSRATAPCSSPPRKPFPPQNNSFYTRVFMRAKLPMGEGHST